MPYTYEYDLAGGWLHEVTLQGNSLAQEGVKYPICVDGAMACPPEYCGGVPGYYRFLSVLSDRDDEEHEDLKTRVRQPVNWLACATPQT